MSHQYVYIFFCILIFVIWWCIYMILYNRRQTSQRQTMWRYSLFGACLWPIAELRYLRDYRNHPSLMWHGIISVEDFLFGFAITGISAICYDLYTTSYRQVSYIPHPKILYMICLWSVVAMIVWVNILSINSIFISSGIFFVSMCIILIIRPDLLYRAMISMILILVLIMPLYIILFERITIWYRQSYRLMYQTKRGLLLFGSIPWTEFLRYTTWAWFVSVVYQFKHWIGDIYTKTSS